MIFRRLSRFALCGFALGGFALGRFAPKRFTRFAFFALCVLCAICGANLATLNAYDFSKCKEFYLNTSQVFSLELSANGADSTKEIRAFHIGEGKYLAFVGVGIDSITNENILFYDRFVGLALFSGKKMTPKYDLLPITKSVQSLPLAGITSDSTTQGKIISTQKSLKNKAQFSRQIPPNAILSDICYQSYGISVGANRFIDKAYITRFLAENGARIYSDIGFEIETQKGALIVKSINPFVEFKFVRIVDSSANRANNANRVNQNSKNRTNQANLANQKSTDNPNESLRIGDEILAINGISVKNEDEFFDIASTLEIGKRATIRIRRGNIIMEFSFMPLKRERGFDESGTLLDFFGIVVDERLSVIRAPMNSIFKKGDRILRLNQIKVSNKAELNGAIWRVLRSRQDFSFLLTRKDFEFFITFKNEVK